jgi:hypothetical protein
MGRSGVSINKVRSSGTKIMTTVFGWLFGLSAKQDTRLSAGDVTLRPMSEPEKIRILRASQDFFARDTRIWNNCIQRFPLVFQKTVPDDCPIGSIDSVALVLSLLAPGEVRTPVVWSVNEAGGGGGASDSQIIDCFYRLISGRFQIVDFDDIREAAVLAFDRLKSPIRSSPYQYLDPVLIDRLLESKEHILSEKEPSAHIIGRAADVCIGLESLYAGGPGETQFKLAISLAWLLEADPLKREQLMIAVKETYKLRSKIVHGGRASQKPLLAEKAQQVLLVDRLFRRSVLTLLLNNLDETKWLDAYRQARLGVPVSLDTAEWVTK